MLRRNQEQQRQGYAAGGQQQYGPAGAAPSYGAGQPSYQGGNATPSAAWPMTTPGSKVSSGSDRGAMAALSALALGGVLALAYAIWAFTARRGVFADFSDGTTVSTDDAKSSDTIDTIFLLVAGLVALIALGLWIARLVGRKSKGDGLDLAGIAVAGIGVVVVLVGLFLASGIADADGQAAQGDKGVTATLITGGGFLVLAVGLLMGLLTVRGPHKGDTSSAAGGYPQQGYGNW